MPLDPARLTRLHRRYPLRRAAITGTGSGLGEALALTLAGHGWTLLLNDNDAPRLAAIASAKAYHGLPGIAAYVATKAAVVQLSETLRSELKPYVGYWVLVLAALSRWVYANSFTGTGPMTLCRAIRRQENR